MNAVVLKNKRRYDKLLEKTVDNMTVSVIGIN